MNIFNSIFGKKKKLEKAPLPPIKVDTLEDFSKLSNNNRMLALMEFGDRPRIDISHFPFFQFAILYDNDKNVKLAALKRIHAFKDHPETLPMMTKLMTDNNDNELEPYLSMALSRLELISPEDFEKKINNLK